MKKLVLLRHGQSKWNLENRFTGWKDIDLSEKGVQECINAGKILKEKGYTFDVVYTSYLKRAIRTTELCLKEMGNHAQVKKNWRLNERHYGALTGLNKQEMREKHGDEQVHIWRRSFDVRPPLFEKGDKNNPSNSEIYAKLKDEQKPMGE
ncbi:MAG: 2,3-bisphosphoglycerate-dependent phosphoglycerate mutase, partial [archaeon]|nr:2,3-bisphosphoglycerate-dependent phosphoglycerate mutase [archaeon]